MPAHLKSWNPSCSISAIGMQRHTGFGLHGCLMFITARAVPTGHQSIRAGTGRSHRRRGRRGVAPVHHFFFLAPPEAFFSFYLRATAWESPSGCQPRRLRHRPGRRHLRLCRRRACRHCPLGFHHRRCRRRRCRPPRRSCCQRRRRRRCRRRRPGGGDAAPAAPGGGGGLPPAPSTCNRVSATSISGRSVGSRELQSNLMRLLRISLRCTMLAFPACVSSYTFRFKWWNRSTNRFNATFTSGFQNKLGKGHLLYVMPIDCSRKCARSVSTDLLRNNHMSNSE